jgi:rhodanese-related sulfurtransferase
VDDGRALGVRATPTFFIGRQRIEGVLTAAQFSQLVTEQLATLGVVSAEDAVTPAAAAAPEKPATKSAAPHQRHADATQPHPSTPQPIADPPPAPTGFLGAPSPGGFVPGLQGTARSGPFGVLQGTGGGSCNESDAAKTQPTLIHTPELRQLLANSANPLFVDVRPAGDYAAGRIPGAINLPADDVERRWNTLPRDRTIILYESGRSSGDICAASRAAGRALLEHGFPFSQVKVYQDGLVGWERAGISMDK